MTPREISPPQTYLPRFKTSTVTPIRASKSTSITIPESPRVGMSSTLAGVDVGVLVGVLVGVGVDVAVGVLVGMGVALT